MTAGPATFAWNWRGRSVAVTWEEIGDGPSPVLCLPAFSTVSTREELRPLALLLADRGFRCILLDWPGFGGADRLRAVPHMGFPCDLRRSAGRVLAPLPAVTRPPNYALELAPARPGLAGTLALIAPTWCGPLPTTMEEYRRGAYDRVRRTVCALVPGEPL